LRGRNQWKAEDGDEHDEAARSHASLIHLFLGIGDER
jgi:hypothetical protein